MLESFVSDKFTYKKIPLEEQKSRGILGRLTGVIADTKNPTRNGRSYSSDLWKKVFDNDIMKEKIANRCVFSELGHPVDREEVDLDKVCACLAEQPKLGSDGKLYGVFDILDTNNGRILKTLCDYGTTVGVSSRGTGDLYTDENGNEAVDPDTYNCECFDIVIVPAVKEARLQYVTESLNKTRYNKSLKTVLQESLDKANEDDKKIMAEALDNLGIKLDEEVDEAIHSELKDKKPIKGDEPFTSKVDPDAVKKVFEIFDSMSEEDFNAFNDAAINAYAPLEKDDNYKQAKLTVNKLLRKYNLPAWALKAFAENWDEVNEGLFDREDNYKDWDPADVELHKNTDWKARNYDELEVPEDSFEDDVVMYRHNAEPEHKTVKFTKRIRPNNIFPPYYAPAENPFEGSVGSMYDGKSHGKYDIHNRYEDQETYDRLSESRVIKEASEFTEVFRDIRKIIGKEMKSQGLDAVWDLFVTSTNERLNKMGVYDDPQHGHKCFEVRIPDGRVDSPEDVFNILSNKICANINDFLKNSGYTNYNVSFKDLSDANVDYWADIYKRTGTEDWIDEVKRSKSLLIDVDLNKSTRDTDESLEEIDPNTQDYYKQELAKLYDDLLNLAKEADYDGARKLADLLQRVMDEVDLDNKEINEELSYEEAKAYFKKNGIELTKDVYNLILQTNNKPNDMEHESLNEDVKDTIRIISEVKSNFEELLNKYNQYYPADENGNIPEEIEELEKAILFGLEDAHDSIVFGESKECNNENCTDKEDSKEVVNDKSETELVAEFQESLKTITQLEGDNLSLKEQLSVCIAKENELQEQLAKYKKATVSLSDTAKEVKPLKESIEKKDNIIKSDKTRINNLTESLKKKSSSIEELTESKEQLDEQVKTLNESLEDVSKQLENSKQLVDKYRKSYASLKESFLEAKAKVYGINKEDLKKNLTESYKIKDIDSTCEKLVEQRNRLDKLPIRLGENTKINFSNTSESLVERLNKNDDDYVSDLLKSMID